MSLRRNHAFDYIVMEEMGCPHPFDLPRDDRRGLEWIEDDEADEDTGSDPFATPTAEAEEVIDS